jgi:hypothetical protein
MLEIDIFKQHYFLNRLMWIRGPVGSRKVRTAYQLLKLCGANESDVLELTSPQFIDMWEKPSLRPHLFSRKVLLIKLNPEKNAENLAGFATTSCLPASSSAPEVHESIHERSRKVSTPETIADFESTKFCISDLDLAANSAQSNLQKTKKFSKKGAFEQLSLFNSDHDPIEKVSIILNCIQSERFRLGIRVVLISPDEIEAMNSHNPFVLQIPGWNRENSKARVQQLLDQAIAVVGKKVDRLSDCAANFFEKVEFGIEDEEDFLELLILGVARSEGGVVRLTDLFRSDILESVDLNLI